MKYNLEFRELGVWSSILVTESLIEACREASLLTLAIREEWIRILDWNNKEL